MNVSFSLKMSLNTAVDEGGLDAGLRTLSHCSGEESLTAISAIDLTHSTSHHPAASYFKNKNYLLYITLWDPFKLHMINYPNREENGGLLEVQILPFLSTAIFKLASVFTILIRIISKKRQDEPLCTDALKHCSVHRIISDSVQSFHRTTWKDLSPEYTRESQQNWHLSDCMVPSTVLQFSS